MCFRNHFFINLIAHTLRGKGLSIWQFCRHWCHRKLSSRQLAVSPVMAGLSSWRTSVSEYDIALYILALFICRRLAFWLMIFVVHMTLKFFYVILFYLNYERKIPICKFVGLNSGNEISFASCKLYALCLEHKVYRWSRIAFTLVSTCELILTSVFPMTQREKMIHFTRQTL